jgi:type III restriction enzyme
VQGSLEARGVKIQLTDYQLSAARQLIDRIDGVRKAGGSDKHAFVLSAPTGSGKTAIVTAAMEALLEGDGVRPRDPRATFLWVTDAPELNEQTKKKILASSEVFTADHLITIDSGFDQPEFDPGSVYFLNTQKLGSRTTYTSKRDSRTHTLWESISRTSRDRPGSFFLVLDEAHKGLGAGARAEQEATTIAHRLIAGDDGFQAPRLLVGVSATPQRLNDLLERGKDRVLWPTNVNPEDARASGLLKDEIVLWHTERNGQTQWALLEKAAEKLADYERAWRDHTAGQHTEPLRPILLVQVADGTKSQVSRTDLGLVIRHIENAIGPLAAGELVHCFQDTTSIDREDGPAIVRVAPSDIQDNQTVRVVLFKMALNTGWDCPRAEVMMSFRRAADSTLIAQLVGRMVRTPEARRVVGNPFLNAVSLYLPNWKEDALERVIRHLTEGEESVPIPVARGENSISYRRAKRVKPLFDAASGLPTYPARRLNKDSNVKRSLQLARYLAADQLRPDALGETRNALLDLLEAHRKRLKGTMKRLVKAVKSADLVESRIVIGIEPQPGSEGSGARSDAVDIQRVDQDILDFFTECGRRLGAGLHVEYVKRRTTGRGAPSATVARAELCVLTNDGETMEAVEKLAGERVRALWQDTHHERQKLAPDRRADYARVNRMALAPEAEDLELPTAFDAIKGSKSYKKHLFVDADGDYHPSPPLNSWERAVLAAESGGKGFRAWLRNPVRKEWSLGIPYEETGIPAVMYPDFLIFRSAGRGGIVVDILEPHASHQSDLAPKLGGLCKFADRHGDRFGRIELILLRESRGETEILRIDANEADVRGEAKLLTENRQVVAFAERLAGRI